MQRECSLMAAEIIFSILTSNMPNPTNLLSYATYRLTEINKNSNLFTSNDNLKPTDLLISLIDLSEVLIAYNDYELVLPVLALAEHISCDVIKSTNYLMKTRILKTIALADLGLISEAMQSYIKIIKKVDLPNLYNQNSLYFEKSNGKYANIQKELRYFNHLTPDDQKNVDTITSFFKLGTGDLELKYLLQANLHSELIYARSLIIFKTFEKENYLNYLEIKPDIAFRLENLSRIEKEIRDVILQLAVSEEINTLVKLKKYLTNNSNNSSLNLTLYSMGNNSNVISISNENNFNNTNNKSIVSNNNNVNNINRPDSSALGVSGVDMINKRIEDISNLKKITNEEINHYYLTKNFFKEDVEMRSERFDCIIKSRLLLARIYQAQSLFLNASGIALKGLENNKKFIEFNICGLEQADDFICNYILKNFIKI